MFFKKKSQKSSETIKKTKYQIFIEYVKITIIALAIAMLLRSFVFEPFKIPSSSMEPNLLVGDRLIVSKYPYGYGNYSTILTLNLDRPIMRKSPLRGDIIVFRTVNKNDDKIYIKRLIGLPGEEIQLKKGVLYINDIAVKRDKISESPDIYEETLPNGVKYKTLDTNESYDFPDTTKKYQVPDNHYFFLGDNRDNSIDSRYTNIIGFIPEANLIGRAEFVFWNSDNPIFSWIFEDNVNFRTYVSLR